MSIADVESLPLAEPAFWTGLAEAEPRPRATAPNPARRLAVAVLDEALHTVRRNVGARRGRPLRELREAYAWFQEERRDWTFSFLNVCDWLELDPHDVRGVVDRELALAGATASVLQPASAP
ncbi:MAG TPA: hypothetical protein VFD92_03895 [Candidatus Binatia bacterium]|nr:hypothetical protein [Candidatus Binatia bacterium]